MGTEENVTPASATHGIDSSHSLSALLSQVLVAFTVEFDNEFERRIAGAGYPGERLSLVVWANLLRFVGEGAISARDLARQALVPDSQVKFELGCLERWGFVVLQPNPPGGRPVPVFVQTGWFALLPRAIQRARFGRRYSARSSSAGRAGLEKTRSAACERLCRALRTNWMLNYHTACPALGWGPTNFRPESSAAGRVCLWQRCFLSCC